jgi:voltage-gated potassium channel
VWDIPVEVVASLGPDGEHGRMSRLTRAFVRFQKNPSSVRYAVAAIISTTALLVFTGAIFMRVFDSENYPTFGQALWFTLQTVTTVGYGDNTPTSSVGRIMAASVMLVAIGLITVVTAVITSMFIRSVSREQDAADQQLFSDKLARIEASLAQANKRLAELGEPTTSEPEERTRRANLTSEPDEET